MSSEGGAPERPSADDPGRSAAQIRSDIGLHQSELSRSMEALRSRMTELSDWRRQVREHRTELIAGAALVGFVIGGLVALGRRRPS